MVYKASLCGPESYRSPPEHDHLDRTWAVQVGKLSPWKQQRLAQSRAKPGIETGSSDSQFELDLPSRHQRGAWVQACRGCPTPPWARSVAMEGNKEASPLPYSGVGMDEPVLVPAAPQGSHKPFLP